jgi:hypothetical protein
VPTTTWAVETLTAQVPARPEFFRLPKPGSGDPYFGFSRSFYYVAEKRGWVKLIRIRDAGKMKGVTLIRFQDVLRFVQSQMAAQNGGGQE